MIQLATVEPFGDTTETKQAATAASPFVDPDASLRGLQVILKTIERCNLACPYCYYFFQGDESYKDRPAAIKLDVIDHLVTFLAKGIEDLRMDSVTIVFHGGEPLMQKKSTFDSMCTRLRAGLGDKTNLGFAVQTNGTLIDDKWIDLFEKHQVNVGVSIDGPASHHDLTRYDHKKRGSHAKIVDGLRMLKEAAEAKRLAPIGTLSVVSHTLPLDKAYQHLHSELGINSLGFLLPDRPHDGELEPGETIEGYGESLIALFESWVGDSESVRVRELDNAVNFFQLQKYAKAPEAQPEPAPETKALRLRNQIVVIQSDGDISLDDSLIPALEWRNAAPKGNIRDTTLRGFLSAPVYGEIHQATVQLPEACGQCKWQNICMGGALENRYSKSRGFDNSSVYCEALKMFYEYVVKYLLANGYPQDLIDAKLDSRLAERDGEIVF